MNIDGRVLGIALTCSATPLAPSRLPQFLPAPITSLWATGLLLGCPTSRLRPSVSPLGHSVVVLRSLQRYDGAQYRPSIRRCCHKSALRGDSGGLRSYSGSLRSNSGDRRGNSAYPRRDSARWRSYSGNRRSHSARPSPFSGGERAKFTLRPSCNQLLPLIK
jgi:hypothetical protein